MQRGGKIGRSAIAAMLLFALSLALRWPGVVMYDSVGQYGQALEGVYTDWHPPIMAHLWALLIPLWPGAAPFLVLQMALWWGGLGLIAAALERGGQTQAALWTLAIGAFPLFLGWGTVTLKDAQMAACLIAAAGLIGWWRLTARKLPIWVLVAVTLLLTYATLVRGNAVFATIPFVLALADWGGVKRWWLRTALAGVGIVAVLGLNGPINHKLFHAEAQHNDRSLPLWDIVAVAHRAGVVPPGLAPVVWAHAEQRGCYTPYFWNPYGEPAQCDAIGDALALSDGPHPRLMRDWAITVASHPIAYAAHRLAHFNATSRFLVGFGEPDAIPPVNSEPNNDGLGGPSNIGGRALVLLSRWTNYTPLGWPIVWLAAALALAWGLRGDRSVEARLARALILSALVMSGSFLVASIASDLRYHLWSMIAVALALVLGVPKLSADRRRTVAIAIGGVAAVALIGHALAPSVYVPIPGHVPSIAGR